MLDKRFWMKIATEVVSKYNVHIFGTKSKGMKAKDVFGKDYPDYKDKGKAKKKGTGHRQREAYKNSKAPVYSGDLMNDFQLRKTKSSGFSFGTTVWGSKVKRLLEQDRVISSEKQPIPKEIISFINKEADKYVKKQFRKIKGKKININISK